MLSVCHVVRNIRTAQMHGPITLIQALLLPDRSVLHRRESFRRQWRAEGLSFRISLPVILVVLSAVVFGILRSLEINKVHHNAEQVSA